MSPFLTTFTFSHFYFLLCNIFTETIFCVPFLKFSLSHISTYFSLHNKFIETIFTPFPLGFCILLCNIFIETMSVSLLKTFTFSHFYFSLHKKLIQITYDALFHNFHLLTFLLSYSWKLFCHLPTTFNFSDCPFSLQGMITETNFCLHF